MKVRNCSLRDLSQVLGEKRIICFGASQMAVEALAAGDIGKRTLYFVDNDVRKQERLFHTSGQSFPVRAPERLRSEDFSDKVIMITSSWFRAIMEQLELWPELADVECFVYPSMCLADLSDRERFFQRRIVDECLKEYGSALEQQGIIDPEARGEKLEELRACLYSGEAGERPLVLPRIMLLPTTRCNMRCKGCSSLLPLFGRTEDVPVSEMIADMEQLFGAVDRCIRVTVGGEPFLYSELAELLRYLAGQEKVLSVLLITNSTILPSQELLELLRAPKFYVEISDYGHIEKMSRTVAALEQAEVRFSVFTGQVWQDMGGTEPRGRTEDELRQVFLNCDQGRIMKAIHRGRFYICARSARMHALDAYHAPRDYLELHGISSLQLRDELREFYFRDSAEACDRCDLGAFPVRTLEAGVQMTGRTVKSGYTLVKREEYERLQFADRFR